MRKKTKENEVIFLEREEKDVQFYEIYGSSNVAEMCMLNDKYKAIHPQVRCKDFIQDLFWLVRQPEITKELKENFTHGFQTGAYISYPLINRDIYRVGIRFRTEGQTFRTFTEEHREASHSVLNHLEKMFEFPLSNVFLSKTKKEMVFEFSPKWTKEPYLVSLYLLLIRLISLDDTEVLKSVTDVKEYLTKYPERKSGNDAGFIKRSEFILDKLFNKEQPKQGWDFYTSFNGVHHSSGIVSFSSYLKQIELKKKNDEAKEAVPG